VAQLGIGLNSRASSPVVDWRGRRPIGEPASDRAGFWGGRTTASCTNYGGGFIEGNQNMGIAVSEPDVRSRDAWYDLNLRGVAPGDAASNERLTWLLVPWNWKERPAGARLAGRRCGLGIAVRSTLSVT
jgi:hypothetical protein